MISQDHVAPSSSSFDYQSRDQGSVLSKGPFSYSNVHGSEDVLMLNATVLAEH